jgi:hypothetical protein
MPLAQRIGDSQCRQTGRSPILTHLSVPDAKGATLLHMIPMSVRDGRLQAEGTPLPSGYADWTHSG